ncbi:polyvinylalcohol dehydrogenase-like [Quillaja saponaria]|uniref:Polyvinylalcohol dehydrogenase-like n=1 Tax=Quillaja saponaria TaxID=32244 RepID=A0AAD7Q426_QUISA|nr:polyvinylalcohol dehydrogenase-like [Quillaja saponaria]
MDIELLTNIVNSGHKNFTLMPSKGHGEKHKATQNWINHGGDLYNRRYANKETKISPATVSKLRLKWKFFAGKDITATPAIFYGTLYIPSWNGYIYAVKASNGSLVWKQNLQKLTGINNTGFILNVNSTVSRSTPTIAGNLLIIGIYGPGVVIALKRSTGKLVWSTKLDNHNRSVITMSGTYHKGSVYIGTSSLEEGLSIDLCCTFRGSFSKLDARTGTILWQTFMLPDNVGKRGKYAGAAIWGSSPALDISRNLAYIATGNLYSAPPYVIECQEKENNQTIPTQPDKCIEPDNHSNSILAIDLDTGKIKWYKQLGGYDVWFFACNLNLDPRCPPGPSPDADFGEAPMMLSIYVNGIKKDIVVAVQKSGYAWALDRNNGNIVWSKEAGPGGLGGGGIWGAATVAISYGPQQILMMPLLLAPVSVANGVLFAGSTYREGPIYAMNAKNGKILWSYDTGATVYGGISVSNGCVYLGNGYTFIGNPNFTAGTSLYAFCIS